MGKRSRDKARQARAESATPPPEGVQPVLRFKNPIGGSVVWDDKVKGRIEFANARTEQMFGYGPEELVGEEGGVHVPRGALAVDEDRPRPEPCDRAGCREEAIRRGNHFVARAYARSNHCQVKRCCTV